MTADDNDLLLVDAMDLPDGDKSDDTAPRGDNIGTYWQAAESLPAEKNVPALALRADNSLAHRGVAMGLRPRGDVSLQDEGRVG